MLLQQMEIKNRLFRRKTGEKDIYFGPSYVTICTEKHTCSCYVLIGSVVNLTKTI